MLLICALLRLVSTHSFTVCTETPGAVSAVSDLGVTVERGLATLDTADTVIVPGFFPRDAPSPQVLESLRGAAARGARVASVCVGAFALAAAGLLDGLTATTHWEYADELATRFPAVRVRPEVLYVDQGNVLTSAGIAAGIDLCLHLVRVDHGAAAAAEVSRRMVAALHRPGGQAQFMQRPIPATAAGLAATCAWSIQEMDRPLTVAELARHAGYAPRTLNRHFLAETGMTPMRWLTAQRVLEARRLLETSDVTIEEVARRCGLGTAVNLRVHLARETATTPTAYRNAFRGAPAQWPRRPTASRSAMALRAERRT